MSDALAQAVAAEIRAEKGRQRVSGRELARRVALPTTTVSRWLRGDTALGLDELDKLAAALDVDMIDIIRAAQVRVKLPRLDSNQKPAGLSGYKFESTFGAEILPLIKQLPAGPALPPNVIPLPTCAPARTGSPVLVQVTGRDRAA